MVTGCTKADHDCDQYDTCNIRDPLWRIKDQIVQALTAYSLKALAADEAPPVPISLAGRLSEPGTVRDKVLEGH